MNKVWNKNFALLLQGNFVSALGDVIYEISLGVWILVKTGSTGLMGTLMGATVLARVLTAPFAGVVADKFNRKWIIVWMDIIRGITISAVAVACYYEILQIWMLLVGGIIIGITSAFFMPAVQSLIPHLVPSSELIRANGFFSSIHTAAGIIGNAMGGFFCQFFGVAIVFALNAVSFFVSALSEIFISLPAKEEKNSEIEFSFADNMKEGFRFAWGQSGIRYLLLTTAVINFCSSSATILILPLFQKNGMGSSHYGIVMASFTAGMFASSLFLSVKKIAAEFRFSVFKWVAYAHLAGMIFFPFLDNVFLMSLIIFLYGFGLGINGTLMLGAIQIAVPNEMRGKVLSMMGALSSGLIPLGMATGGILGEYFSLSSIISAAFLMIIISYYLLNHSKQVRQLINWNPG